MSFTEASPSSRTLSLVAVGDIMAGDSAICVGWGIASKMPGPNFKRAIRGAAKALHDADILIGNLEATLTNGGVGTTRWQRDQMRASPEIAPVLRTAGFNAISVANNHAMQHGEVGFKDTVRHLRQSGIFVIGIRGLSGWTCEPVIITISEIRVGMLAYCWRPRQYGDATPLYAEGNFDLAKADIQRLSRECDCIVVSLHWGEEFSSEPSEAEVAIGDELLASGANIIVGHHPHAIRPIKAVENGFIAYSLGNFVSDMIWLPSARYGGIVRCEITTNGIRNISTTLVSTNSDFETSTMPNSSLPTLSGAGLSLSEYGTMVSQTVKHQHILSYAYFLRNIYKYRPLTLIELVARTGRNKILSAFRSILSK